MEEQARKNAEILAKREREREEEERKQQELFKSHSIDLENYKICGPGPYTFYCWADAIESLFDSEMEDENPLFYHKQSVLDAFKPVLALPKDDREEAMHDYLDVVSTWHVSVDHEACEASAATRLCELWGEVKKEGRDKNNGEGRKASGAKKGPEEDGEEADGAGDDGWWFEVYAQRQKPEEGKPAMEMVFEDDDELWLTGFKAADLEGRRAMYFMCDFFMDG